MGRKLNFRLTQVIPEPTDRNGKKYRKIVKSRQQTVRTFHDRWI